MKFRRVFRRLTWGITPSKWLSIDYLKNQTASLKDLSKSVLNPPGPPTYLVADATTAGGSTSIYGAGFKANGQVAVTAIAAKGGLDKFLVGGKSNASGAVSLTVKAPVATAPDVVIVDEPLFIVPNPEVIEPAFKAPTVVTLDNVSRDDSK